ncbi:MAG: sulfatase [Spirochaetia bacterium]|nr:sulfatase [Spirochaetia bacterium]
MKILWLDIDSLRPDHLGCYGYHRNTSPVIDSLAAEGMRYDAVFASDAPCLPSRTAWQMGRPGIQTGVINHGGCYADPFRTSIGREFNEHPDYRKFIQVLRAAGYRTASVSTFAERHAAWWFHAGFGEVHDVGKQGLERAEEVIPAASRFIQDHGTEDDWFLHVNLWDPHTPYRTPDSYGDPFKHEEAPAWPDAETIRLHQDGYGPHSATAVLSDPGVSIPTPRELSKITSREDFRHWINGYDTGIRYADDHVGQLLQVLSDINILDETVIIISADHGECQGEFNIYGDHQVADISTCRLPWIIRGPGFEKGLNTALHYHYDMTAGILSHLGISIPAGWDSIPTDFSSGDKGRSSLVISQAAWSCQRSVLFDDYILMKTYHSGLKDLPQTALFNWRKDPHQTCDLSNTDTSLVCKAHALLDTWIDNQLSRSPNGEDPMRGVIKEGGPYHTRGKLKEYISYYQDSGRPDLALKMQTNHQFDPGV